MKIKAQMAMVLNLDKCIGCHTCSIPCKNVWTQRAGSEYIWFNNVESKPGIGYPKKWEDQSVHRGGWQVKNGRLSLRSGGPLKKSLNLFHNPDLPAIDEYYEPWTYDYDRLISSPARKHQPAIRPVSQITGENMAVTWGPNWEDDLAGVSETGTGDVNFAGLDAAAYLAFERVFMFYLPRLCEHCLNPACVASCPSGALYKREEDGIVLVDQERCRGWRYCVSGCPYKKVYFNWKTGRSEKCIFCYPRTEAGLPTLCALSCVGKIRYIGAMLYDAERICEAASVEDPKALYRSQESIFLDPRDPKVFTEARKQGISENFLEAAKASPVLRLIRDWKLALPLHPEYRTLPMVWYVPPLSPVVRSPETETDDAGQLLSAMRIPTAYLANLLAAGDQAPVRRALFMLTAVRRYMRSMRVGDSPDTGILDAAGIDAPTAEKIYRLLALARLSERFVIPTRKPVDEVRPYLDQKNCGYPG
jgi:nitrate reductase beta subunit